MFSDLARKALLSSFFLSKQRKFFQNNSFVFDKGWTQHTIKDYLNSLTHNCLVLFSNHNMLIYINFIDKLHKLTRRKLYLATDFEPLKISSLCQGKYDQNLIKLFWWIDLSLKLKNYVWLSQMFIALSFSKEYFNWTTRFSMYIFSVYYITGWKFNNTISSPKYPTSVQGLCLWWVLPIQILGSLH